MGRVVELGSLDGEREIMWDAFLHALVTRSLSLFWLVLLYPAAIIICTPFILLRAWMYLFAIIRDFEMPSRMGISSCGFGAGEEHFCATSILYGTPTI